MVKLEEIDLSSGSLAVAGGQYPRDERNLSFRYSAMDCGLPDSRISVEYSRLSAADDLAGPWTKPRPFFSYPEMQKGDLRYTAHVFCYAAKEHPDLETAREMAFTYACNSTEEPEVLKDTRLYRPILVRQTFPVR